MRSLLISEFQSILSINIRCEWTISYFLEFKKIIRNIIWRNKEEKFLLEFALRERFFLYGELEMYGVEICKIFASSCSFSQQNGVYRPYVQKKLCDSNKNFLSKIHVVRIHTVIGVLKLKTCIIFSLFFDGRIGRIFQKRNMVKNYCVKIHIGFIDDYRRIIYFITPWSN